MKRKGWRGESYRHYLAAKGIKSNSKFNIAQLQGRWRQKSVTPEPSFQKGCKNVQANYELQKDGTLKVKNFCQLENNDKTLTIEGKGFTTKDPKKLKVDFFPGIPFTQANFNITKFDGKNLEIDSGKFKWKLEKIEDKKQFLKKKNYLAVKTTNESYIKWRKLVNMSPDELKKFKETEKGKKAGLTKKEAKEEGIVSGQESAEAILRMREKSPLKWTDKDEEWMKRQNSFIARMKGIKGPLFKNGELTRKHTALKIWGHDPLKENAWK